MAKSKESSAPSTTSKCPISRDQFRKHAPAMLPQAALSGLAATRKEFATGSLGWYANGKMTVVIDGQPCIVQVGCNFTIVGSKELGA